MVENKCGMLILDFPNIGFFFLFTLTILLDFSSLNANASSPLAGSGNNDLKTYIVHVKQPEKSSLFSQSDSQTHEDWHRSFLPITEASSMNEPQRLVYSYNNVISGFAARLTEDEVKSMEEKDGFVSARPERILYLQTTHTPNFLGLFAQTALWNDSSFGKGMIIGVLDTGILPTHPSFNDEGMPPPPATWKGQCDFNVFTCNNKIIGAKSFLNQTKKSAIDKKGHGTHTASTAAGAFVKDANVLGNAFGTASGMAPYAHLAIYKVCSVKRCRETNILAGLDSAVEDGVDVLSMSFGGDADPFYQDNVSIGSLAAIQKGIFVSSSAGNSGPFAGTISHEAPWILTVGASTTDRKIIATAKLGNGEEFDGESVFQPKDFSSTLFPLIYAGVSGKAESKFCGKGSLNRTDVEGKVVLCETGGNIGRKSKGEEVKGAGGVAMILMNDRASAFSTSADVHVLPASYISFADGLKIMAYINSSPSPMATIVFKGTVVGMSSAPKISAFSSRGPSLFSPGILKPDIIGPGVGILAAWPFPQENTNSTTSTFNIISGTSMSCPHLSGIAALLKSSHPDWSPAAIKSAIMTTADHLNFEGNPIVDELLYPANLFATGSGHVNPSRANHPGLVYDIQPDDYIPYICGLGYTDSQVGILTRQVINCSNQSSIPEGELNYPSFSVKLGPNQTFTRTLTNVGEAESSYEPEIIAPEGVHISVTPNKLYFSEMNQKLTYSVTFALVASSGPLPYAQGSLTWVSPKYFVRSPISFKFE